MKELMTGKHVPASCGDVGDLHCGHEARFASHCAQAPVELGVRAVDPFQERSCRLERRAGNTHVAGGNLEDQALRRAWHPMAELAEIGSPGGSAGGFGLGDFAANCSIPILERLRHRLQPTWDASQSASMKAINSPRASRIAALRASPGHIRLSKCSSRTSGYCAAISRSVPSFEESATMTSYGNAVSCRLSASRQRSMVSLRVPAGDDDGDSGKLLQVTDSRIGLDRV